MEETAAAESQMEAVAEGEREDTASAEREMEAAAESQMEAAAEGEMEAAVSAESEEVNCEDGTGISREYRTTLPGVACLGTTGKGGIQETLFALIC